MDGILEYDGMGRVPRAPSHRRVRGARFVSRTVLSGLSRGPIGTNLDQAAGLQLQGDDLPAAVDGRPSEYSVIWLQSEARAKRHLGA